jgi:hypothetical protein
MAGALVARRMVGRNQREKLVEFDKAAMNITDRIEAFAGASHGNALAFAIPWSQHGNTCLPDFSLPVLNKPLPGKSDFQGKAHLSIFKWI